MKNRRWIYLSITSNTGKILYACSKCGLVTPAPSKLHLCSESGIEMNQFRKRDPFPESAREI